MRTILSILFTISSNMLFCQQQAVEESIPYSFTMASKIQHDNFPSFAPTSDAANNITMPVTLHLNSELNATRYSVFVPFSNPDVFVPAYTQGAFCDLEDYINRNHKFRLDFSVR